MDPLYLKMNHRTRLEPILGRKEEKIDHHGIHGVHGREEIKQKEKHEKRRNYLVCVKWKERSRDCAFLLPLKSWSNFRVGSILGEGRDEASSE
jgi:hypothetical protein